MGISAPHKRQKRILILCGSDAQAITATNEYTAMLSEHEVRVIEETTLSFRRIGRFCWYRLKNKQFLSLMGSLLYYLVILLFQRSPRKNYIPFQHIVDFNTSKTLPQLITTFAPDYVLTCSCGVLSKDILALLPQDTYNIHPGINPLYRGFGNLWALARNDLEHIGYTIHKIDEHIDTGERLTVVPLTPKELTHVACINMDSFVYKRAAQHLSRIILGMDNASVPEAYANLPSQYVGVPTLRVFLKARRHLKEAVAHSPQRILITGASSGLGTALAQTYAQKGTHLILWGRNTERLEDIARICQTQGATTQCISQDIQDLDQTHVLLHDLYDNQPIDMAILAAGVSSGTMPDDSMEPIELACRTLTVNATATIHCAGTLLKLMNTYGTGHIACITSIASFYPLPDSPAYSASKVALAYYIRAMRPLIPLVRLSLIYPGYVDTPMSRRLAGPQPFRWQVDKAASYIKKKLDNGTSSIIFPKILALGIWILNFLPAPIASFFVHRFGFTIAPDSLSSKKIQSESTDD